jgi:hypothetical protein
MLTGGRPSIGPMAASLAGDVYRRLAADNYFRGNDTQLIPATIMSPQGLQSTK